MRRALAVAGAFAAGALLGGAVMLAIPVPGMPDTPPPAPASSPAVLGEAPVPTLLAWTPGELPAGYAEGVRDLRGVEAVAEVRSGVAWLEAWRDEGGGGRPPAGYRIPVEVGAVGPRTYARFVAPSDRGLVGGLAGAILGRTFAELHGVDRGGVVVVSGRRIEVEGVLEDELIGAHEIVVPTDLGARMGIVRSRYLLVVPADGRAPRVESALRRLVPASVRVRVRSPGETPVFRHGDAVLPQVRVKEVFGEFAAQQLDGGLIRPHPAWVRANIRTARVPILGRIRCHRLLVPMVRAALEDLDRRGLGHLVDPSDYGGCYYPRFIARDPGTGLSHHSWGMAIDVNVSQGLPGRQPTLDPRVVEAFEAQGFKWGGEFLVPDGTHFEFVRFPSS
jgi:D-alanyl-D-alanine carboxypeptidase